MQSAIRQSEGELNTRLIDIRRSYNKLVSSGVLQAGGGPKRKREESPAKNTHSSNAKRKISFDCTPLETNDIGPPGGKCENEDLMTMSPFEEEEEVVRLLIHENAKVSKWCISKDAIKHYCSREHLDNPPRCQWVGATDDSGHGGKCGALRLLQLPMAQGGSTWLITVNLGEKLLHAANNHCSREVHVERFEKVRVGSTRGDAGGVSTSHGNNERWVYGLREDCKSFYRLFDEESVSSVTYDPNNPDKFQQNELITHVTVPSGIKYIGDDAFKDCKGLTSVDLPRSLTTIGSHAFNKCTSLTSITFPKTLTSIGAMAFYFCKGLTSITFPKSLTTIGDSAFSGCWSLTSVTLPEGLTSIGDFAFYNNLRLTSITFPQSLTSIGHFAFYHTGLTSVDLSQTSLTSIGDEAFANCGLELHNVKLPSSLTNIGEDAFRAYPLDDY